MGLRSEINSHDIRTKTTLIWVFASPSSGGKNPYWGQQLMRRDIRPVAEKWLSALRDGHGPAAA